MGLSNEVTTVFEEQPRRVFNIWEIAKHIASKRMRLYQYGWLMRWFARKHPQAAEELMRDIVYDKLRSIDITAIPGVDVAKPRPRLYCVPDSKEPLSLPPPKIEAEVRAFILAQRGRPYTRQEVVNGVANQRLDALLNSECSEYCQDPTNWLIRQEKIVSSELLDSSYEKTFG